MKLNKTITYITFMWLLLVSFSGCGSDTREEVLERYPTGEKKVVGTYKGSGSNEILVNRKYYQISQKLGRIEVLEADSVVNFTELYPDVLSSEGLKDFLVDKYWKSLNVVKNDSYEAYEIYSLDFEENQLTKSIYLQICEGNEEHILLDSEIKSEVTFKNNGRIEETNMLILNSLLSESWNRLIDTYGFDKRDFSYSLFVELRKHGYNIDQTKVLGKMGQLGQIGFTESSIGESILTLYGPANGWAGLDEDMRAQRSDYFRDGIYGIRSDEVSEQRFPIDCSQLRSIAVNID